MHRSVIQVGLLNEADATFFSIKFAETSGVNGRGESPGIFGKLNWASLCPRAPGPAAAPPTWLGHGTYAAAFERCVVASGASPASFVHLQLCAQQTRGRINNFDMQIRICYVCQQLEWGVLIGVFYFERITWLKQTFTGNRRRPWVSPTTDTRIIFLWWKKWVCYLRLGTSLCAVFISYEGYDYNNVKLL